jgi:uncharacterized membrane protein
VVGFSDAIFAIAMTLLVLQIEVSGLPAGGGSARDMLDALADVLLEIASFAVSFYVIGRYWLAHHWFYSRRGSSASSTGRCRPSCAPTFGHY